MMVRRLIISATLFLVLALGLMISGCSSPSGSGIQVGNQAPDFTLSDLDGNNVSLSDFRGQGVLLNFWASWCGPCRAEMPYLQQIHEEWSYLGVVLLTVNLEESSATARDFAISNKLSFPVLLDTQAEVAREYGVSGIPTTLFIDKDGIIKERKVGSFPNKAAIEESLGKIVP